MSDKLKWLMPYKPATAYSKKVVYLSMEFAVDQALKIYSGGLGFLAGSHMRSAYESKQNLVGIGMLWSYGYYDQQRSANQHLLPAFTRKTYSFLKDTGLVVSVPIGGNSGVKVKVYYLAPETFGTVPMYFLTTDIEENDFLSRTITHKLYDANEETRIAQSIVLGVGGAKVVEALGGADIIHLNEGHALPAFYYLEQKGYKKKNFVFTTHTPEKAGNEEHAMHLLDRMNFFSRKLTDREMTGYSDGTGILNYTVAALRMSGISNGVSKLHAKVARGMWRGFSGVSKIVPITNSQNSKYWQDRKIAALAAKEDLKGLAKRKKELKKAMLKAVADQTGKLFRDDVLTIVWARRFAGYKRADLITRDLKAFRKLVSDKKYPVQIIWAGKPYPLDTEAIATFNYLVDLTRDMPHCAVLTGYELELSRELKDGADIWLNNPRITREASGTSGMTAAMNGAVNLSTDDGWIPEFARNGKNAFVLPALDYKLSHHEQDEQDLKNLYKILHNEVLPLYYDKPEKWLKISANSINEVVPEFESGRMAADYYTKLYK